MKNILKTSITMLSDFYLQFVIINFSRVVTTKNTLKIIRIMQKKKKIHGTFKLKSSFFRFPDFFFILKIKTVLFSYLFFFYSYITSFLFPFFSLRVNHFSTFFSISPSSLSVPSSPHRFVLEFFPIN